MVSTRVDHRTTAVRRSILAAAALAALLGASPAFAEEPRRGGTLTVARPADIFTFDPYNTQDDRSIFTELTVYERLVKLSADGHGVEPELATAWTVSPDGLTADFTLRQGVRFSNGAPLTAEDVVFSLTRAIDQSGSWGFLFSPVTGVSRVNDGTVRLTMSEPFAPLLPALSTFAASIYQKANFESSKDSAGEHPLGTAAFMLDHWDKGQQVVLKRNPNYWQAGKPYLDSVVFRTVGDDNARVLQLASGDVQLVTDVPVNQVDQVSGSDDAITVVPGSAVGFVTINEKVKPLDEAAVRCALSYAIDRSAIATSVYFGKAAPAKSILPSSTFFYDPNTNPIGFDLDKAKSLLAKSSVPNGFALKAQVPSGDSANLATAQIWADALAKIGVSLTVEQLEATTAQDQYNAENYTLRLSPWTNDTPDPDELMGVAFDYKPQNGLHSSYHSDEARDLVLAARRESDATKRQALYSKLQNIENRDCPFLYTVEQDRIFAASPDVKGFKPNSQGKYGFEDVFLAK